MTLFKKPTRNSLQNQLKRKDGFGVSEFILRYNILRYNILKYDPEIRGSIGLDIRQCVG